MRSILIPITAVLVSAFLTQSCIAQPQAAKASWLDEARPQSWNEPDQQIPAAPRIETAPDPRCRRSARAPQLDEDRQIRDRGWELVGPFQGGWDVLIIQGTASYDGMCRPLQYQSFVFVRGAFACTLAPEPMNSRSDGALGRTTLQSQTQLTAEYSRYDESDALCCPSRRTVVTFEISANPAIVRPNSTSTSPTTQDSSDASSMLAIVTEW